MTAPRKKLSESTPEERLAECKRRMWEAADDWIEANATVKQRNAVYAQKIGKTRYGNHVMTESDARIDRRKDPERVLACEDREFDKDLVIMWGIAALVTLDDFDGRASELA